LELFLRQTQGFRLALALHNDSVERDRFISGLRRDLEAEGIQLLILDLLQPPESGVPAGLLNRIEATFLHALPGHRAAVMVTNLEAVVRYVPELPAPVGQPHDVLATANLQRDRFPEACPGPVILWMTELLERAFVKEAPDLWSWRSHVFDLRTRKIGIPDDWLERSSDDRTVHPEVRLQRLEEELAAYRRAGSKRDEIRVLIAMAIARKDSGDFQRAREIHEEALRLARETDDARAVCVALTGLGNVFARSGDKVQASVLLREALELVRAIGDVRGEAHALNNLGTVEPNLGRSIEMREQALAIVRKVGDVEAEGQLLNNLGTSYWDAGYPDRGVALLRQRLALARQTGDRRGESNTLGNLGLAFTATGELQLAIQCHQEALRISREIGDRRSEAIDLGNLGISYGELGDVAKAMDCFEEALHLARQLNDQEGQGRMLCNLALALHKLGPVRRAEAIHRAEEAQDVFAEIGDSRAEQVEALLRQWRGEKG
jgi:tetratricopeptide (TPR) repeat protein